MEAYKSILNNYNFTGLAYSTAPIYGSAVSFTNGKHAVKFSILKSESDALSTGYYDSSLTSHFATTEYKHNVELAIETLLSGGFNNQYSSMFADIANINFVNVSPNQADIVVGQGDYSLFESFFSVGRETSAVSDAAENAPFPSVSEYGDIWINAEHNSLPFGTGYNLWDVDSIINPGTSAFKVILEELSHSLGVDIYDANGTPRNSGIDSQKYTVTSYVSHPDMEFDGLLGQYGPFPTGLQLYDIAALQAIYGANTSIRNELLDNDASTTGTTYGIGKGFGSTASEAFVYTIWDGGGITDNIDATGYTTGVEIDLREGHFSSIGDKGNGSAVAFDSAGYDAGNVAIAFGTIIENAIGTDQSDRLLGNRYGNVLTGQNGNDYLNGEAGNDTLVGGSGNDIYEVVVDASGGHLDVIRENEDGGSDTLKITASGYSSQDLSFYWSEEIDGYLLTAGGQSIKFEEQNIGLANVESFILNSTTIQLSDVMSIESIRLENYSIPQPSTNYNTIQTATPHPSGYGFVYQTSTTGTSGNDLIIGHSSDQTINGGNGDDGIGGDYGNDTINGGAGNDWINGGPNDDILNGNSGNDHISGGGGNDTFILSSGTDLIFTSTSSFNETLSISANSINYIFQRRYGSSLPDNINSETLFVLNKHTGDASFIMGHFRENNLNSIDEIEFNDITFDYMPPEIASIGSEVGEVINGAKHIRFGVTYENFVDRVFAGTGNDTIQTYGGNDFVYGQDGNDTISGGTGDDHLFGDAGNDTIYAGAGNDDLYGGIGADSLHGEDGNDIIHAGDGDDVNVKGGDGSDRIYGDSGNDVLDGEVGADTLYGGSGTDTISGGDDGDWLYGGFDNDLLYGQAGDDVLGGDDGNDTLYGGDGADYLWGNAGNDSLEGQAGNDALRGLEGNDILLGGDGNDNLRGDDVDSLGSFLGGGDDILSGGAGNDNIAGGIGDDILFGDAGQDVLFGGEGDDLFMFDIDSDSMDTISDFVYNSIAFGEHDRIDISDLIAFNPALGHNVADYVMLSTSGSDVRLIVDRDGAAIGNVWEDTALIKGGTAMGLSVTTMIANGSLIVQ